MNRSDIAIVGGGISGLSAAYYLEQLCGDSFSISLFDAAPTLGGKLQTLKRDGLTIECGPDSIFTNKPWAYDLICELGLEDQIISPAAHSFSIVRNGVLHKIPMGIVKTFPHNLLALWKSDLLSWSGKLNASIRPIIFKVSNRLFKKSSDVSLEQYLNGFWGKEVAKYLFGPLYGGIHAGSAARLSVRALYPHLLSSPGKIRSPRTSRGFVALRGGMAQLIQSLLSNLKHTQIRRLAKVEHVEFDPSSGFRLLLGSVEHHSKALILALPAFQIAELLRDLSPSASKELSQIKHAASAIVTYVFDQAAENFQDFGSGFIIPAEEGGVVSGCTISSSKWPQRAPDSYTVLRIFLRPGSEQEFNQAKLQKQADRALEKYFGALPTPVFTRFDGWLQGVPQYEIGHLERVEKIRRELVRFSGLQLIGVGFEGIGIPDCIRQGKQAAQSVFEFFKDLPEDFKPDNEISSNRRTENGYSIRT